MGWFNPAPVAPSAPSAAGTGWGSLPGTGPPAPYHPLTTHPRAGGSNVGQSSLFPSAPPLPSPSRESANALGATLAPTSTLTAAFAPGTPTVDVTIRKFRAWDHAVFQFPLNQITMIKGKNGCGKSTIAAAIMWCFHGKLQRVTPNSDPDAETNVTVTCPTITVYRQRKPARLVVMYRNGQYEDDIAQAVIANLFGTLETWHASCYVAQESRNLFLTASTSDKLAILNSVSFQGENPPDEVAKIDQRIRTDEPYLTSLIHTYQRDNAEFERRTHGLNPADALDPTQTAQLEAELNITRSRLAELDHVRTARLAALQLLQQYSWEEHLAQHTLSALGSPPTKPSWLTEPNLEQVVLELSELCRSLERVAELRAEWDALPLLSVSSTYTPADYQTAVAADSAYHAQTEQLRVWGIGRDSRGVTSQSTIPPGEVAAALQDYLTQWSEILAKQTEYQASQRAGAAAQAAYHAAVATLQMACATRDSRREDVQKGHDTVGREQHNVQICTRQLEQAQADLARTRQHHAHLATRVVPQPSEFVPRPVPALVPDSSVVPTPVPEPAPVPDLVLPPPPPLDDVAVSPPNYHTIDTVTAELNRVLGEQDDAVQAARTVAVALSRARDILACPRCHGSLRYHNHTLVVAEGTAVSDAALALQGAAVRAAEDVAQRTRNQLADLAKERQQLTSTYQVALAAAAQERQRLLYVHEQAIQQAHQAHQQALLVRQHQLAAATAAHQQAVRDAEQKGTQARLAHQAALAAEEARAQTHAQEVAQYKLALGQTALAVQQAAHAVTVASEVVRTHELAVTTTTAALVRAQNELTEQETALVVAETAWTAAQTAVSQHETHVQPLPLGPILTPAEIEKTSARLAAIRTWVVVFPPPVPATTIYLGLQQQEAAQVRIAAHTAARCKYEAFRATVPAEYVDKTPAFVLQRLREVQTYASRRASYTSEVTAAEKSLAGTRARLADLVVPTDPNPEIIQLSTTQQQQRARLDLSVQVHEALTTQSRLREQAAEITRLTAWLGTFKLLRQFAVNAENKTLESTAAKMNASINGVCSTMFERQISVKLDLFKESKSTGRVNPTPNLKITYKGAIYDGISQLSGGESARASIALTIALNRLSQCPLLLLDESTKPIDESIQKSTLETITRHASGAVVLIAHAHIQGDFHHTIDIDEMTRLGLIRSSN